MISAIQAMTSYLYPHETTDNGWYPLDRKVPAQNQVVIVWDGHKVYCDTYAGKGPDGPNLWYHGHREHGQITHWRPIPDPPKEQKHV